MAQPLARTGRRRSSGAHPSAGDGWLPPSSALGGQTVEAGLPVLLQEILPELILQYRQLLDHASPVREAPVMALLALAVGVHGDHIERGNALLQ